MCVLRYVLFKAGCRAVDISVATALEFFYYVFLRRMSNTQATAFLTRMPGARPMSYLFCVSLNISITLLFFSILYNLKDGTNAKCITFLSVCVTRHRTGISWPWPEGDPKSILVAALKVLKECCCQALIICEKNINFGKHLLILYGLAGHCISVHVSEPRDRNVFSLLCLPSPLPT